jgi:hypothetical protein
VSHRVYLVVCRADIESLADDDALSVEGRSAYAVTAGLQRTHPEVDDEDELEYLAYAEAVAAAQTPRLVLAADVAEEAMEDSGLGATVVLRGSLPRSGVVSFHVDDIAGVDPADDRLLWYDVRELDDVVALLS